MKKLILLALLLCTVMQAGAAEWTDSNGIKWSFTVNGTEATDIVMVPTSPLEKHYLYGGPDNPDQLPFQPTPWQFYDMRFDLLEGNHFPTIPDDVYFGLKKIFVEVSDVSEGCTMRVMNSWWSENYYDNVLVVNGLNEVQITKQMAIACAESFGNKDLTLMLLSGSCTVNAVYYEMPSVVPQTVAIPAKVYSGSTELTVTSIGSAAFAGCNGMTSVTIPSSVSSIGFSAFFGCTGLTSVNFPSGLTTIGDYAFSGCTGLTGVNFPSGVTTIGDYAFSGCTGLTSVTIPSGLTTIGDYMFSGCTGVTSVTIPSSLTTTGEGTFARCHALKNITIPSSVTSIGSDAFFDSGLTSVTIPSSVTSIGGGAFASCDITSVTIPSSVTSISSSAFQGCNSLTSINVESGNTVYDSRDNCNAIIETETNTLISGCINTVIPNTVTAIGSYAFTGLEGLTKVTIPSSVKSIGTYAFQACTGLTSVTIPEGVEIINPGAFLGSGLQSVELPSTLTFIGDYAFAYCNALTEIFNHMTTPLSNVSSTVFSDFNATLYVPASSLEAYQSADVWKDFSHIESSVIEETIDGLKYSFDLLTREATLIRGNYLALTTVDIPKTVVYNGNNYTVTAIGDRAFYNCTGLTSVTIPSTVTNIDSQAFEHCTGLTGVTFPEGVKRIGNNAFYACTGLTSVIIPSTVTSISTSAFYNCSSLTSVTINSRIVESNVSTSSGLKIIFGTQVNSYIIGEGVTRIGNNTFYGCTSLTSVSIPSTVTRIQSGAFYNCTNLTNVYCAAVTPPSCIATENPIFSSSIYPTATLYVPGGSIQDYKTASIWKNFKNIELNTTVITVNGIRYRLNFGTGEAMVIDGNYSALTSAEILGAVSYSGKTYQVTAIASQAFKDCTSLNLVTIPSSMKSIGSAAFQGCTGLSYICLPEGVTSIGEYAFDGCIFMGWVALPSTLTTIGSGAFRDCASWMQVFIHNEIPPTIDSSVFTNGISILDVKDDCVSAYQNAAGWQNAGQIKEMTCIYGIKYELHDDMTATAVGWYGNDQWLDCSKPIIYMDGYLPSREYMVTDFEPWALVSSFLKSAVLPENLTSIPEGVFAYCYSLSEVFIPGSVTSIGMLAFYYSSLTSIVSYMENPPSISEDVFSCYDTATLYVPAGSVETYQNAPVWKKFNILPILDGDVDGDGVVDVADFTVLANYLLGKSPANFHSWAADVAGSATGGPDGEIDIADLTGIANIILHGNSGAGAPKK